MAEEKKHSLQRRVLPKLKSIVYCNAWETP